MQLGTILGWALPLAFVISVYTDPGGRLYSIEPIIAPAKITGTMQDRDGIAASLRTEVSLLVRQAQTDVAIRPNVPGGNGSQVRIAGTDFTLDNIRSVVRSALDRRDVTISGEMSLLPDIPAPATARCIDTGRVGRPASEMEPGRYRLVLKDDARGLIFDCTGTYDGLLQRGGFAVFVHADPFSAATLLARWDRSRNFEAARLLADAARAEGESASGVLRYWPLSCFAWPSYDVPRAHLTLGNLYLEKGRLAEARDAFERANASFAGANCLGRNWYAAEDGLAIVALIEARNAGEDLAARDQHAAIGRAAAMRALALKPDFDAGLFHRAESFDIQYGDGKRADCQSAGSFSDAATNYDRLIAAHPLYSTGYDLFGDLLQRRVSRLHAGDGGTGCPGGTVAPDDEMRDLLRKGVSLYTAKATVDSDKDRDVTRGAEKDVRADNFWDLLATVGFETALAGEKRPLCPAPDPDWFALLDGAVGHFQAALGTPPADEKARDPLGRALAARHVFAPGRDPGEAASLREAASHIADSADRRRVERLAQDLAACDKIAANAHPRP